MPHHNRPFSIRAADATPRHAPASRRRDGERDGRPRGECATDADVKVAVDADKAVVAHAEGRSGLGAEATPPDAVPGDLTASPTAPIAADVPLAGEVVLAVAADAGPSPRPHGREAIAVAPELRRQLRSAPDGCRLTCVETTVIASGASIGHGPLRSGRRRGAGPTSSHDVARPIQRRAAGPRRAGQSTIEVTGAAHASTGIARRTRPEGEGAGRRWSRRGWG